ATAVGEAGVMSEGALVSPVRLVAVAVRVFPVPVRVTVKFEVVATPDAAATVAVPESVPPAGFVPIATVTFPLKPVAMFSWASNAVPRTAGVIAEPAVVLVGCTVKARWVAAPAVTAMGFDVALVRS